LPPGHAFLTPERPRRNPGDASLVFAENGRQHRGGSPCTKQPDAGLAAGDRVACEGPGAAMARPVDSPVQIIRAASVTARVRIPPGGPFPAVRAAVATASSAMLTASAGEWASAATPR